MKALTPFKEQAPWVERYNSAYDANEIVKKLHKAKKETISIRKGSNYDASRITIKRNH